METAGKSSQHSEEIKESWMDRLKHEMMRTPVGKRDGGPDRHYQMTNVLLDLLTKQQEKEHLDVEAEERRQVLDRLQECIAALQEKVDGLKESGVGFDMFLKDEHINQIISKAEKEREEKFDKEAEIKRLKEEYVHLVEKKEHLLHQLQKHALYDELMEGVVHITQFKEGNLFMVHLENLLHLKSQLCEKEKRAQTQVDQQRKALRKLEDQHHLLKLHTTNQLYQLHKELEKVCSEALTWESKWNHILETAAKKTLLLVKIKMVTLDLFELACEHIKLEKEVDINDTEKQLDEVRMFMQDHAVAQIKLSAEKAEKEEKEQCKKEHPAEGDE
ncbi:coiled-coil domain-containing protein 42 homolog [Nelusetta ayraudi]|uniref:coiled-coil domain-containing protein 42 homolog n=1 Tax=Nelusetta ayraudi TaxID=303726 RepID=UPI003F6F523B